MTEYEIGLIVAEDVQAWFGAENIKIALDLNKPAKKRVLLYGQRQIRGKAAVAVFVKMIII